MPMFALPSRRIAVLAGGDSPEREVSLRSGAAVLEALRQAGWTPVLFDPRDVELADIPWGTFEACLVALHGGAGEDVRIQAELEALGVPYIGSRPAASRRAMSKSAAKERLFQANLPTLNYALVCRDDAPAA